MKQIYDIIVYTEIYKGIYDRKRKEYDSITVPNDKVDYLFNNLSNNGSENKEKIQVLFNMIYGEYNKDIALVPEKSRLYVINVTYAESFLGFLERTI